ncbi:MAG: hypothetical protein EOP53_20750, partial [Sphingobacteriales bacterium]
MQNLRQIFTTNIWPKVFFVLVLLLYLLFPNASHSVDSWGYAGQIKFGVELFLPHHLLYSYSGYLLFSLLQNIGLQVDAMQFMLFMNGFIAWLCVLILYRILLLINGNKKQAFLLSLIAAFSFGQWRFATENETYTLPLFFSLLATFYYLKHFSQISYIQVLLCGFFASLSCLFHQAHIFWFIGFLLGLALNLSGKNLVNSLIIYCLPFLIVPLAYILVLRNYYHQDVNINTLWHFILQDVYSGAAGKPIGSQHFILGLVNLFRTFFQLHGNMILLFKKNVFYFLPIIVTVVSGIWAFYFMLKIKPKPYIVSRKNALVFGGIFLAQYFFAVYNVGNAEFMVMLPSLLVIVAAYFYFKPKILVLLVLALFSWNFFLGIFPNHFFKYAADEEVAAFTQAQKNIPFMAEESALLNNIIFYNTGRTPGNIWQSPAKYVEKYGNT